MPNNGSDSFASLFGYLQSLSVGYQPVFAGYGLVLFKAIAIITIVLFGVKCAMTGTFPLDKFVVMLGHICVGFSLITFYSAPLPLIGYSLTGLISDGMMFMANQLQAGMVTRLQQGFSSILFTLQAPGVDGMILAPIDALRWGATAVVCMLAMAATYAVIGFGFVASSVCVLVGPVLVPFYLVGPLNWIFWGWLKSFIQYSAYSLVANAFLYAFGSMLINFIDRAGGDFSGVALAKLFVPLIIMLSAFCYGLLRVPALCNSIFTGRSGEGGVPRF
ncbi:MAG: hypothetical protein NVS1B14_01640 [Vulcanimicrobiaceae bacterium]